MQQQAPSLALSTHSGDLEALSAHWAYRQLVLFHRRPVFCQVDLSQCILLMDADRLVHGLAFTNSAAMSVHVWPRAFSVSW